MSSTSEYHPSSDEGASDWDTPDDTGEETSLAERTMKEFNKIVSHHKVNDNKSPENVITVQKSTNSGQRIYDKLSACVYCGKEIIKMSAHLVGSHKREEEVKEIEKMQTGSTERKLLIEKLRLKGNFIHNMKVLQCGTGSLLILRRSHKEANKKHCDYVPCLYCLGFLCKQQAYKHMNHCKHKNPDLTIDNPAKASKLILAAMTISDKEEKDYFELISTVREGPIKEFLKIDTTMRQFGNSLLKQKGIEQKKPIIDKLRKLAKFALDYMVKYNAVLTMKGMLKITNFDKCLKLAKENCRSEDAENKEKPITVHIKIGQAMKEILSILKVQAIKSKDAEQVHNVDNFHYLLQTQWSHEINTPSLRTLWENKPKVNAMPITQDLVRLSKYINESIVTFTSKLQEEPSLEIWQSLATVVMANLILFNRRREGEVSQIKLKTYTECPDYSSAETDMLKESLSSSELILFKNYSYMSTRGKRGRPVPIIFSQKTKEALDVLVQHRNICGISNNGFLFANSRNGHIRGNDALQKCISKCNLQKPELIKSTNMRKHVSTVAQVMSLNSNDLEHLSNHLGHDLNIHHNYYRLHESTIETTKIVKLLSLVNTGNLKKYKNKSLDEVELDEVIESHESATNNVDDIESHEDNENNVDDPDVLEQASEISVNVASVFSTDTTPIVGRKRWNPEIKYLAKEEFKKNIKGKYPPKKQECLNFIKKNKVEDRSWKDIKVLIYNEYKKK